MPEKQFEHLVIGLLSEYLDELLMLPLEKPRMAEIDADHEVKQKSHYRQYRDNQKPGDFFRRVSVVEDDDDDGADYEQRQKNRERNGDNGHFINI